MHWGLRSDLIMKSIRLLPPMKRSIHAVDDTMCIPWVTLWKGALRTAAKNEQGQCCAITLAVQLKEDR